MKKHLDYISLTERLNRFRMEHQSKTYTREELLNELKNLGMSSIYAAALLAKGIIPYEKIGKAKLYSFNETPIQKSTIESIYYNRKTYDHRRRTEIKNPFENLSDEERKIKELVDLGYQVRKCVGFDIDRFKRENPVLYKKYLKYEIV